MDSINLSSLPASQKFAIPQKANASEVEPAEDQSWQNFKDRVGESVSDWRYTGKKLGMLASAATGAWYIPLAVAQAVPSLSGLILGPVGMIASIALIALEEKLLGVGKKLGGLAGAGIGAGVGVVKGGLDKIVPPDPNDGDKKVELPKAAPKGKKPHEPLLTGLLHKTEKLLLGHLPERTMPVEIGESIGATVACAIGAIAIPGMVAASIGGPVAAVLGGLVGALLGLVGGSFEENTLGAGRALGELSGTVVSGIANAIVKNNSDRLALTDRVGSVFQKLLGLAGKGFMVMNSAIAEPLMGFLLDSSGMVSKLLREKPVQTMEFAERPFPDVNKERLYANFIKLAGINATYKKEESVANELSSQFDRLNISHKKDDMGNLIASIPATKGMEDSPTVLLNSHMDTVAQTSDKAIINDEKLIHTDERHILGADDRVGIAEIMEGVETVLEKGIAHPEIKIVFTVGEEVGLKGSSHLKPGDISNRPTLGFVVDSTDKSPLFLTNDAVFINPKSVKYNFSQEDPLIQVSMRSLADAGIMPEPIHGPIMAGAGTDANTPAFNSGLIRSVAVGTGANNVHTSLENAKKKDVEQIARAVVGFITNSCDLVVDKDQTISARYPIV